MTALAAHGGPKTVDIPGPHYQWPLVDESLEEAVRAQLHRSLSDVTAWGIIGEFEAAFAAFSGARYAVSFASGTAAIHAMSRIAGLRPGDSVIAPAYTFLATASPFAHDGIEVRFADADGYGNVTLDSISAAWTPNVRAVIVTHLWGNPCAMEEIAAFCQARGLLLMEDCSHAHFASWQGTRVGQFGDIAVFSTNQKAITTGEGGVLVTRHDRYRELAILYAHYNKRARAEISAGSPWYPYAYTGMGLKHRITTLGAAIGVHQLARADSIEARRRDVLGRFAKGLAGNPVIAPLIVPAAEGQHGLYVVGLRFCPQSATVTRDEFAALCAAEGATEVDVPGSTRDISREPLFARRDPFDEWDHPAVPASLPTPGAADFGARFLKLPAWGYEGDAPAVEAYLAALGKVTEAVAR